MKTHQDQVAAEATIAERAWTAALEAVTGQIVDCFERREPRTLAREMTEAMLMELDTRNCWTLAEALGHAGPHRLQHFLSRAVVDHGLARDRIAAWTVGELAGQDAVLIVDETGDAKSSTDCVGAARQYSGALGGIGLYQVAVHLAYASRNGHAPIDRALYLGAEWAADEERRLLAGIPDETEFATKPQLAKGVCGLGQGQTTCWNSWMRWTLISMLAAAVLAVTRAGAATADPAGDLVPASSRELLRLLRITVLPCPRRDRGHLLHWSAWRRRHQHRAAEAHRRWNNITATATT